jgi:hypothetical protein
MRIVVFGLSITSSWGNGHATNYRALLQALQARNHEVLFLERDVPWYRASRDFTAPWVKLYSSLEELRERHSDAVRTADLVIVGSFVPGGADLGEWALETAQGPVAFWDIDTPVTAEKLARGDHEYLTPELVRRYDLYLSFTGGPLLERLGPCRSTAWSIRIAIARSRGSPASPSATSAPTVPTASRRSTGCCSSRRGGCRSFASPSAGRSIRPRSPGLPTSSASSTCRRASIRASTRRSG